MVPLLFFARLINNTASPCAAAEARAELAGILQSCVTVDAKLIIIETRDQKTRARRGRANECNFAMLRMEPDLACDSPRANEPKFNVNER